MRVKAFEIAIAACAGKLFFFSGSNRMELLARASTQEVKDSPPSSLSSVPVVRRASGSCDVRAPATTDKAATSGGPMSAGGVEEDERPGPLPCT